MLNLVLESLAVVTAIMYIILAAKEDVRCWYAALISSILYFYIMLQAGLLMEGGLQIFYVFMAVYGWMQWKDTNNKTSSLKISSWNKTTHLIIISFVITLSLISGIFLEKFTNAALPFLDALTTWGAIASTYMVAKKVIENWFYWFVIDSISIYLFISRELFLTAFLFLIYLVIIIYGYRSWKKLLKKPYDNI